MSGSKQCYGSLNVVFFAFFLMFLINIQRDEIGIGGSWSEFIDYVVASIKSEDVKLILEGHSNADGILSESFFFSVFSAR